MVCEFVFLRGGLAGGGAGFGLGGDAAVRVEAADGAVAFLQDAVAFFEEGFDVLDELFFVQFVFGCTVGFFDALGTRLVGDFRLGNEGQGRG